MKYIDIHCHLNMDDYDSDRKEVIERAVKNDTAMIIVGVDVESSLKAIKLSEENENIWAIIGLHPVDDANKEFDIEKYREMAKHEKVVAIGECGLDYFHGDKADKERQKALFIEHIKIANEFNKPLMLHIRDAKDSYEAYTDAISILKQYSKTKGNVHFFAGNLDIAKEFVNMGFSISFTGVITFARDYDEVIKNIPIEMIMSETDSPYVTPIPYRKRGHMIRDEPSYVIEVANAIADIRRENREDIAKKLLMNAQNFFSIKF